MFSRASTSVSQRCTDPNLKVVRVPAPPLVVLMNRNWLMGAGPELQKCFDKSLTILSLDPSPQSSPWSPHYYRLSRLLFLIAMHRAQPQIQIGDCWEIGDSQPIILRMDKGGFCGLMELRWLYLVWFYKIKGDLKVAVKPESETVPRKTLHNARFVF